MSPGISNGPRTRDWSNPASAVASALLPGSAAPAAWPCWPVDSHTSDCRSYTEYSSLGVRLVECFSWQPGRTLILQHDCGYPNPRLAAWPGEGTTVGHAQARGLACIERRGVHWVKIRPAYVARRPVLPVFARLVSSRGQCDAVKKAACKSSHTFRVGNWRADPHIRGVRTLEGKSQHCFFPDRPWL